MSTSPLRLDIVVATYNRRALLGRAVRSILRTPSPAALSVRVIVADNNSGDDTCGTARTLAEEFPGRLQYLFEPRQGKSYALNSAIALCSGDLIGIMDDDEELHPNWLAHVLEIFQDPDIQYAGGITRPSLTRPLPEWVPKSAYRAVIGSAEGPPVACLYTPDDPDLCLMGGNAVFRTAFLQSLGPEPYDVTVGRSGQGMLTADDRMYKQLLATGARGLYDPGLVVYHAVQPHMLTRGYYRRWCFWNAVSVGYLERTAPSDMPRLFGLPRWEVRRSAESFGRFLFRPVCFTCQLDVIRLAGLVFGRHLFRRGLWLAPGMMSNRKRQSGEVAIDT